MPQYNGLSPLSTGSLGFVCTSDSQHRKACQFVVGIASIIPFRGCCQDSGESACTRAKRFREPLPYLLSNSRPGSTSAPSHSRPPQAGEGISRNQAAESAVQSMQCPLPTEHGRGILNINGRAMRRSAQAPRCATHRFENGSLFLTSEFFEQAERRHKERGRAVSANEIPERDPQV